MAYRSTKEKFTAQAKARDPMSKAGCHWKKLASKPAKP